MSKQRDRNQSIKVAIRIRPLSDKQSNDEVRTCVKVEQPHLHLISPHQIKKFVFDNICCNLSQEQIFNRLGKRCAQDCLEGYNCTIFAYGQTGAGKTYTMMGLSFEDERYEEHRGLIPRTIEFLFKRIICQQDNGVSYIIRCSYLQIYNEQIIDLLNKSNNNLQLRQDSKKGVYVQGISEQTVTKSEQVLEILQKGSRSRHVSCTIYNETSSRSHSVFSLQIESKYTKNGVSNIKCRQFNFIDLAGSERTKLITGERLREGCNINKSLMNLSSVINALSEVSQGKAQHINYRSSKLTFLLKDSLGGNSKTNLIANIHPASMFYQQTLSTLGFARRAKLVKREKASINQDTTGSLQSMKIQIKRLNQQLVTFMTHHPNGLTEGKINQQNGSQIPSYMSEFFQFEIDKQTRFQTQVLKLTKRISHLQEGIKQYSNNQIHLKMIINVYEDKISRLKKIQQNLKGKITNLDEKDHESRIIIEYFQNQRNNFIKLMDIAKSHASANQFIKEILKQAKAMRQDDNDGALRDILLKNTDYLTIINSKLSQIKPGASLALSEQQVMKRIEEVRQQSLNREEELEQRLDQASLELSEYKNRNEQSEKIILEAVNTQLILEQQIKTKMEQIQVINQEREKIQMDFDEQKSKLIKQICRLKDYNLLLKDQKLEMSLKIQEQLEKSTQSQLQLQNNSKIINKLRQINHEVNQLNNKYYTQVQNLNGSLLDCRKITAQLTNQLQVKNQSITTLQQSLAKMKYQKVLKEKDIQRLQEQLQRNTKSQCQLQRQRDLASNKLIQMQQLHQQLNQEYILVKEKMLQLHKKWMEIQSKNVEYRGLLDHHHNLNKETEDNYNEQQNLEAQIHILKDEVEKYSTKNQQLTLQNDNLRQKLSKYQLYHRKVIKQLDELNTYKIKLESNKSQMDRIQNQVEEQITSKQRLFNELRRQKEDNLAMKKLIQKKSEENTNLQKEVQQKTQLHQQLVQKCIEQQKQRRKATSSEHYLKTIEHLQKSRSQQVQLKRQNEELKKVFLTLKESIKQKQAYARDIERKTSSQVDKLKSKLENLQKDYKQLERNHELLIKEKNNHEHFLENNSDLKDQIRYLRSNSQKIAQKNDEMSKKIKKANLDSLKLERQYQQIKRSDSLTLNRNDKESYIQKLKTQIAVLKTEKGILTQAINKQRQQRSKLSYELKCGSGDIKMKLQLQKKYNENKNLTQLIFEIINQLKIGVQEPKAKLEVIRSLILGEIRQNLAVEKSLKEKIKRIEKDNFTHGTYVDDYKTSTLNNRQLKTINLPSNNQRFFTESSSSYKYEKYKDSATYLKNFSIQNMRDFDKFNARLKYNENDGKKMMFQ